MMFTWLNKQGVQSDRGFEFQITGRFTAEYRENGRVTELYVEHGGTQSAHVLTIYEGSLDNLLSGLPDPFGKKRERDRLLKNVREALAFMGSRLDLAPGPQPNY